MKLPSKKIVPIIIACFAAGTTITIAATYQPPVPKITLNHLLVSTTTDQIATDGSWKTTVQHIAGSSTLPSDTTDTSQDSNTSTQPLNRTQQIAQDLLSGYLATSQGGQSSISDDLATQLSNQVTLDSETTQPGTTSIQYQTSDLNLVKDDSDSSLKLYGNAVAEAIINNGIKNGTDSEMSIMDEVTQSGDHEAIKKFDPIISSYKNIVSALLKVPTPPSAVSIQLNMINDFSKTIAIDYRLENYFQDPADSIYALKDYQTISIAVYQDIVAYGLLLQNRNIVYSPSDPAFGLVHQ